MSRKIVLAALSTCVVLISATPALAGRYYSSEDNKEIHIVADDAKPIYAAGETVSLESDTASDFIGAGATINVKGAVTGSVFSAGNHINIAAPVTRSARLMGQTIVIHSNIDEDLSAAAAKITIEKNVTVGGDVHAASSQLVIDGHINGSVYYAGEELIVNGTVDGDIMASVARLSITDTANVSGKLTYSSRDQGSIAPGVVRGAIEWKRTDASMPSSSSPISIITSFIMGLLLLFLFRFKIERVTNSVTQHALAHAGYGLLFVILVPLAALLLMITIVGMPTAFWLLGVYMLLLSVVSTLTAIVIGEQILRLIKVQPSAGSRQFLALLIGIVAMIVLGFIPIIGIFAKCIIMLIVLGAFLDEDTRIWRHLRKERMV